jgi:hypothetical protein
MSIKAIEIPYPNNIYIDKGYILYLLRNLLRKIFFLFFFFLNLYL